MMRGLHTPVRAIRRRVFKEVAQLGFKADADTLLADMEAIPYAIVNEDSEKYEKAVYRRTGDRKGTAAFGDGTFPASGK